MSPILKLLNFAQDRPSIRQNVMGLLGEKRWRAYAFTFVTEIVVLLSSILTLRLTGMLLGTVGFGEYSVARRAMSVLAFPLLLGLGISIPRYVALCAADSEQETSHQRAYFLSGVLISTPVVLGFCILALTWPEQFTQLFFGESGFAAFALPIVLVTIGLHLQTVLYGYFRGLLKMQHANLFRLLTTGIIPPVAVLLSDASASRTVTLTGISWIGLSLAFGAAILVRTSIRDLNLTLLKRCVHDLLTYGVPRVPGEFALFGLFAIPTFVVSYREGVEAAGFFSFGISVLQLLGAVFATVGILLLPHVSRLRAQEQWRTIEGQVSKVLWSSAAIVTLMVLVLQLVLEQLVPLWMGQSFVVAIEPSRWLLWGAIPYIVYMVLRNPIDAVVTWPHNSINLVITLIIAIGLIWFGYPSLLPQIGMFFALVLLSIFSWFSWRKSMRVVQD